jgi:hypothetical protein
LTLLNTSCKKEGSTNTKAFIINNSNHHIKLEYYANGMVTHSIVLIKLDSINAGGGSSRGIANHSGFNSAFGNPDSAIVIFDNFYKMTHYNYNSQSLPLKGYIHDSKRNLGNYLSFDYNFIDESKHYRREFYRYIFTEQDYLDAL